MSVGFLCTIIHEQFLKLLFLLICSFFILFDFLLYFDLKKEEEKILVPNVHTMLESSASSTKRDQISEKYDRYQGKQRTSTGRLSSIKKSALIYVHPNVDVHFQCKSLVN